MLICSLKANAQLSANFTANITSGCSPLVVQFQDQSTGNPTSWKWDLGNGAQSIQQNPTATYFTAGSYAVKLVIRNAANNADSITKSAFIIVRDIPTVNFSLSDSVGCYPKTIQFTDNSIPGSGTINEWQWDFGDGNLSNQQNPVHTYTALGNFGITLRVKNTFGCQATLHRPNLVQLQSGVVANFNFTSSISCQPPTTATFTNLSVGSGILTHQWNFGDGGTSTLPNPVHVYNSSGSYSVTLITTSSAGCSDTITRQNSIIVGGGNANFAFSPACAGSPVAFTNTSTPASTSALWNFGDGTTSTDIDPIKTFAAGTYQVKLVSTFGACSDSVTRTIIVNSNPTASFSQTGALNTCSARATVFFSNNSIEANTYLWSFGDGTNSTQQNPTHTYTTPGSHTVSLIVTSAQGCRDTLIKPNLVTISPPRIDSLANLPYTGCTPYNLSTQAFVTSIEPVVSYLWTFGDGGTSTLPNPTHLYTTAGSYDIKLVITTQSGCKDSLIYPAAINLGNQPNANFSASPLSACADTTIHFTDNSTGTPNIWFWSFGDGGTSTDQNPIYQYGDTGVFTVTLIVGHNFCFDTIVRTNYITIFPPIARFNISQNCDSPFVRGFTDASVGAMNYAWNFGDGQTANISNPVHTYAATGNYIISLTVTNGTCSYTTVDSVRIIDEHPTFIISDTFFCRNTDVTFTADNFNASNIASFTWLFGDGNSLQTTSPQIVYSYTASGNYTAGLISTDIHGCSDTIYYTIPVNVYGPTAGFSNPEGTCINRTIPFTDTSRSDGMHNITEWTWNYGDNQMQTYAGGPFQHQYNNAGTFPVALTVKDSYGCYDSVTHPLAVIITDPIADFVVSDSVRCRNNSIQFTNNSSGLDLSYAWNFGNGDASTNFSPSYAYSNVGQYAVTLSVIDRFGCTDTIIKQNVIKISDVKAMFSLSDTIGLCPPLLVNNTNQSLDYTSVQWDFGDGGTSSLNSPSHFYTQPGNYTIKLYANGYGNCIDSASKQIIVRGPSGTFTYGPRNICSGTNVSFTATTLNNASFVWDFSDGTVQASTDSIINHNYTIPGLYRPKMILVDSAGCQIPVTGLDTIRVVGVEALIGLNQNLFCDSASIMFRDSSIIQYDVIQSHVWSFGDGTTSSLQNPLHQYSQPGHYTVSHIVTTALGCVDTAVLNPSLKIVKSPEINIQHQTAVCESNLVHFTGQLLQPDTSALSWNWDLGNGNASDQNPSVTYNAAGTYNITLTVTNSSGCFDTDTSSVLVHPLPIVTAGPDSTICRGQAYSLHSSGAATYAWTNHPSLSCINCSNPIATPDSTIQYVVTGTNTFGCQARDSLIIRVFQPFDVSLSNADTLCAGESTRLVALGANSYVWSPSAGLSDPNVNNPLATPTTTTTYTVVGRDSRNCFTDTGRVMITVYPIPNFGIVPDDMTVTAGTALQLNTSNSADITRWRWLPSIGLSCNDCPQPTATPRETITYTAQASNDGGCTSTDKLTLTVVCNGGNVFVPNTFSPNGDGMNDAFYVRGKGLGRVKLMKIFNRWGNVVFQAENIDPNDASAGWNGTYKGSKLTPDVYVYIVEVVCDNNTIIPLKGNVTLIQ